MALSWYHWCGVSEVDILHHLTALVTSSRKRVVELIFRLCFNGDNLQSRLPHGAADWLQIDFEVISIGNVFQVESVFPPSMYQSCTEVECDWLIDSYWRNNLCSFLKGSLCSLQQSFRVLWEYCKWPSDSAVLGWISPQEANWKRWIVSCMVLLLAASHSQRMNCRWIQSLQGLEVKLYPRFSSMVIVYSMFASLLCWKCKLLLRVMWPHHEISMATPHSELKHDRTHENKSLPHDSCRCNLCSCRCRGCERYLQALCNSRPNIPLTHSRKSRCSDLMLDRTVWKYTNSIPLHGAWLAWRFLLLSLQSGTWGLELVKCINAMTSEDSLHVESWKTRLMNINDIM